ncbi:hypothetical protein PIB30_051859 [Stylosanthes scabra]|uniref:Non-haem dioxygenase N-terminal domain-containing protein n=1 Tax=Stylosanthes scabra TaxID=79078 RepID=A0ABU6RIZ1_9FABA|nr:hypothetical protein [Stylosanthes scabra]
MINSDDSMSKLKAFDDTKAGVKGLVDEGVTKIPTWFHHPPEKFPVASDAERTMIPVIDLEGVAKDPMKRQQVVSRIREACEIWGFFQVVNHGIPLSVLEDMKDGVRRFFEQDVEDKKEFYTHDSTKPFFYQSNFDLYNSPALNWRDSFGCQLAPHVPKPEDFPELITNDKFKSVQHRVLSNLIGPRISVGCFFGYNLTQSSKLGPIKKLSSKDDPPKYKETTIAEYIAYFKSKGLGKNALEGFRI